MWRCMFVVVALGTGCGGAGYTIRSTGSTPSPVADVFACVRAGLAPIGYTQTSYDVDAHRVTARRYDETVRRPDIRFRRMVDELDVEVRPDSSGKSALVVESKTFSEYMSERGQTYNQEVASDSVRVAGRALLARCAP